MGTNFKSMNGPELVAAYNGMIDTALGLGITWHIPTRRFSGVAAGVRRCEELEREILEEAERRGKTGAASAEIAGAASAAKLEIAVKPAEKSRPTSAPTKKRKGGPTIATRVRVLVTKNPRTTPKTIERFNFWKNGTTIGAYAEAFPHPKGKTESQRRAIRDFNRARSEGWLAAMEDDK